MDATRSHHKTDTPLARSRRIMRRNVVSYETQHSRIRRRRDLATKHLCHGCGTESAEEWAYDQTDSDERYDAVSGNRFSMDVDRYHPMCRLCHRSFDARQPPARRYQHPKRKLADPIPVRPADVLAAAARSRRHDLQTVLNRVREVA